MTGRNLYECEREALGDLLKLVEQRAAREQACRESYDAARNEANREVTRARKQVAADREREKTAVTTAWEDARKAIQDKFTSEQASTDKLRDFTIKESRDRAKTEHDKTQTAFSDALWTADSLYEAAEKQAADQLDILQRKAAGAGEAIERYWSEATPFLERGGLRQDELQPLADTGAVALDDPLEKMEAALARAGEAVGALENQKSLKRAGVGGFVIWLLLFAVVAAIPAIIIKDNRLVIIGAGLGVAIAAALVMHLLVRSTAMRKVRETAGELSSALFEAGEAREELLAEATGQHQAAMGEANSERDARRSKANAKYPPVLNRIADRVTAESGNAEEKHERDSEKRRQWQYDTLRKAESHFGPLLQQSTARHDKALAEAEKAFEEKKDKAKRARNAEWDILARDWREGQDKLLDAVHHLRAAEMEYFLPWEAPYWKEFPPVEDVPQGIRFGSITVDMNQMPGGVPVGDDLAPTVPIHMELPAYMPFPDRSSMIIRAKDQGRDLAVQQLQTMMLRFLTAMPAGKVRFTVVDPVGLGDNFAAFMHLADYDENMIGARIWTEAGHIEKRLADLTAHMENVIQKYLRNQYKSIEEYNRQAGEVAEPFRVLVVANFPANFNLEAARRLVSIVQSGSTCGVCSIISIDTKLPPPQGFNMADLEQGSVTLVYKNEGFIWKDPDFQQYPLKLKPPPSPDEIVRLVKIIGERGRNANRVEVPFDSVIPKPEAYWTSDSRKSIGVPIGRSGATKFQMFQLGIGTAQHALVAGKTGSGKSTLLHALITNLALHYSPDEIELYLIDFKKGVEFKAYAEAQLPHAKVIAVESEREFGLSVLQRLDVELRLRGDRFRDAGVNDVAGYRAYIEANHLQERCPRIMLIVDEFQEFFVEDDRIAQETALLLDRLVRQGRAFGLHILMGSQTLGGAYSLARSTIDQMAVRIALQCSDADAQLILNKDNTAARLLTRPGEAIYNDANGLAEGNDLFQIVYLSDKRREELLDVIKAKADAAGRYTLPLVFEGTTSADVANNVLLSTRLNAPGWPTDVRSSSAWLGEAIAIKDPTAAAFRPHSGNHLLMVGQHEEAAMAIAASALVSLAAQYDRSAEFTVLDGTMEDDPHAGYLGKVAAALPHTVDFVDRGNVGEQMTRLGTLVAARQKGEQTDRSARFVIVHGIQRFRDLRKEEEMGFGRRGTERVIPAAEHFANILREGPAVGVHVLVWCDVLTNLNRSFDRQLLREFAMRVVFQMNANDSSTLIDLPVASRLGRNRALFLTEEMPSPEKFRPFGLPSEQWLNHVKERFAAKS